MWRAAARLTLGNTRHSTTPEQVDTITQFKAALTPNYTTVSATPSQVPSLTLRSSVLLGSPYCARAPRAEITRAHMCARQNVEAVYLSANSCPYDTKPTYTATGLLSAASKHVPGKQDTTTWNRWDARSTAACAASLQHPLRPCRWKQLAHANCAARRFFWVIQYAVSQVGCDGDCPPHAARCTGARQRAVRPQACLPGKVLLH